MSLEKWKRELDSLVDKIEQHSTASLWKIKRECDRSGLPVGKKFRKLFLRATNERIAATFDRLRNEPSSRDAVNSRHQMVDHSRSKSKPIRRSPSTYRKGRSTPSPRQTGRRSRSRSRSNRPLGPPPRKLVGNSSTNLTSIGRHQKADVRQSRDFSRGKSMPSSSRKRVADRTSSRNEPVAKLKSKEMNEANRVGKETKIEATTAKLQSDSMIYGCVHCANSKISPDFYSDDIDLIYGHWLSAHTDLPKALPFQFYVTELVACHFCNVNGTFPEMIEHQTKVHSKQGLAIAKQLNRGQCALCNQIGELYDHFERAHKNILSKEALNPFRVTDGILKEVLNIDVHKRSQCGHCETIFETLDELEHHNSTAHPDMEIISNPIAKENKVDLHCEECNLMVSQKEYFKHLEEHSFQFRCSECKFQTNILTKLMTHDERVHKSKLVKIRIDEFTSHLKNIHSKSKMIFGNGLVLSNFNLKGTRYDKSSKFSDVLKTLEERIDGLVRKRSEAVSRDKANGKSSDRGTQNALNKDESSESDTDTDSDTFSMSSETTSSSSLSLSSSFSSTTSQTALSKSDLHAELMKQNELVNNLSITGIPCLRNENLLRIFDRICVKINAPVTQNDVHKIFRTLGPNQPIIVKMKTWTAKAQIKNCFKHKDLWSSEIVSLPDRMPSSRIFINLHTTRFYGKMVQIAKYYKTNGIIRSYYLCENGLLVRSFADDEDFRILSKQELLHWVKNVKDRQFKRKLKRESRAKSEFDTRQSKYRRCN